MFLFQNYLNRTLAFVMVFVMVLLTACNQSSNRGQGRSGAPPPEADMKMVEVAVGSGGAGMGAMSILEDRTDFNTEEYDRISENEFRDALQNPLSTFSIDVDKASYSNVRRFLTTNQMPYKDAVRIEEMINYFEYDYPQPQGEHPFSITAEAAACAWNAQNKLIMIGLQGKKLNYEELHPSNLVFLIDVSGSMNEPNKIGLLKKSFSMMIDNLTEKDRVAIVVYAGAAGMILPSTNAAQKQAIAEAIERLQAGGSTAGGEGIQLAYEVARQNYIKGGNNRVILATDGDFNVGVSSTSELVRLVEEKRKDDIYLTICGFGMGNYKDGRMENIAKAGNGNYFYIDNIKEAQKVFVKEMRANLFTIARDVKIQVEFNPAKVKAYRLVGYENRLLAAEDFNDDKKDAGELGAGHTVTALYEVVPAGSQQDVRRTDDLKYQQSNVTAAAGGSNEMLTVKFRYKPIKEEVSKLIELTLTDRDANWEQASENLRFAAAVAGFGMILRDSAFKGDMTYDRVHNMAQSAKGKDSEGLRSEFVRLVETAKLLSR